MDEQKKMTTMEAFDLLYRHNDNFTEYCDEQDVMSLWSLRDLVEDSVMADGFKTPYIRCVPKILELQDNDVLVMVDELLRGDGFFVLGEGEARGLLDDFFFATPSYEVDDLLAEAQEQEHKRTQVKA